MSSRADTLALFDAGPDGGACELLVRINALGTRDGLADVLAILEAARPPPGLMLPKVRSPDEIALLAEILDGEGIAAKPMPMVMAT